VLHRVGDYLGNGGGPMARHNGAVEFYQYKLLNRALLPGPGATVVAFQTDEVWDCLFRGFVLASTFGS
jgi:hypothetical protein